MTAPNTVLDQIFVTHELSEEASLEGSKLTELQVKVIQLRLVLATIEKLNLDPAITDLNDYIQREAYQRGVIYSLRSLLDLSEEAYSSTYPID